jgi:uncharacterized beta-barrel protein YwiB (DUF1934 family)
VWYTGFLNLKPICKKLILIRLYEKKWGVWPLTVYPAEQMPVKITVKTVIRNGQEKETYELITFGHYYKKMNSSFLRYDEMMEDDLVINTVVKMSNQEGAILRNGAVKMRLPFQKNKTLTGSYESPYGVLAMKTSTTRISHKFDENVRKGEIDLLYDLRMDGSLAGTYHLTIIFEEDKHEHS